MEMPIKASYGKVNYSEPQPISTQSHLDEACVSSKETCEPHITSPWFYP